MSKLLKFGDIFRSEKFFVREVFLVALASCLASLVIFTFTKVFFDPNFVAMQLLVILAIYVIAYLSVGIYYGTPRVAAVFPEIARYTFSISGMVIIAICLSPVPMAVYFKKDKDFANKINVLRNLSDGIGLQWKLVDYHSGARYLQPILVRQVQRVPDTDFILLRSGKLISLNAEGAQTVLLDFTGRVGTVNVENGAVGFALHPEFGDPASANKGYAYIHYTDVRDGRQINRLSRFDVSVGDLSERLASETVLIEQSRNNSGFHNGGSVEFGPDGFLYLGVGDGNDGKNLQTISRNLFAGIFRIDVDAKGGDVSHPINTQPKTGATANYMIPSDNPFVGKEGVLEEFWALGLRNPFRFSFDRKTGMLWVGDVGADQIEEIDIVAAGGNYQFPFFEGRRRTEAAMPDPIIGTSSAPYFTYRHKANERAVIGGIVYRGDKFAELNGKYVFADNSAGQLYAIESNDPRQQEKRVLSKTDQFGYVGITSIVENPAGDILVTTLGSKNRPTGRVMKLVPKDGSLFGDIAEAASRLWSRPPATDRTADAGFDVNESYVENCSRCHGAGGRGAADLEGEIARIIPDFTDPKWQASRSDEELFDAIYKGGEGVGKSELMPPWEGVLSDSQTKSMIKRLRAFNPDSE